jgi:hypothetical protein
MVQDELRLPQEKDKMGQLPPGCCQRTCEPHRAFPTDHTLSKNARSKAPKPKPGMTTQRRQTRAKEEEKIIDWMIAM